MEWPRDLLKQRSGPVESKAKHDPSNPTRITDTRRRTRCQPTIRSQTTIPPTSACCCAPTPSSAGSSRRCSRCCASSSSPARSPPDEQRRGARLPRGAVARRRPARRRDRRRRRRGSTRTAASTRPLLAEKADRYHAAVRRLRHAVDRRVRNLTASAPPSAAGAARPPAPEPIAYACARAAPLRPAVALHPLRRRPARGRGRRPRRRGRRRAARAVRPRHDQRRLRGDRGRRAARRAGSSRPSRSPPSTTAPPQPRELHILGYNIDHTGPPMTSRLDGLPGRPRAAHAAHARRAARGRLRPRRSRDRGADRGGQTDRPPAPRRRRAPRSRQRRAPRGGGHRRRRLADPRLPDRGQAGLPPARRRRPSPRRSRRSTRPAASPIWAHPFWDIADPDEVLATPRALPRARHRRRRGLLHHPRRAADAAARRRAPPSSALLTTGSADFHGPENRQFHSFMAFETYGLEPNLGPIG